MIEWKARTTCCVCDATSFPPSPGCTVYRLVGYRGSQARSGPKTKSRNETDRQLHCALNLQPNKRRMLMDSSGRTGKMGNVSEVYQGLLLLGSMACVLSTMILSAYPVLSQVPSIDAGDFVFLADKLMLGPSRCATNKHMHW